MDIDKYVIEILGTLLIKIGLTLYAKAIYGQIIECPKKPHRLLCFLTIPVITTPPQLWTSGAVSGIASSAASDGGGIFYDNQTLLQTKSEEAPQQPVPLCTLDHFCS